MKLTIRNYQNDEDYWRARNFFRDVFMINNRNYVCWDPSTFDYWRWHAVENHMKYDMTKVLFFWETSQGQLAAILHPETHENIMMHIHPHYKTTQLEEEMVEMAETCLAVPEVGGERKICIWAMESDQQRKEILTKRGYQRHNEPHYARQRFLDSPIPDGNPPDGYTIRSLGDIEEHPARILASWYGFHPDEPIENRKGGWDWYKNIQRAPLYRRDLDIVAVTEDGEIASFCTAWFDDTLRIGMFEPVATVPTHLRRGLGKAVMCEALRRLKRMGADKAFVGNFSPIAGLLYASAGFVDYNLEEGWEKSI